MEMLKKPCPLPISLGGKKTRTLNSSNLERKFGRTKLFEELDPFDLSVPSTKTDRK